MKQATTSDVVFDAGPFRCVGATKQLQPISGGR